MRTSIQVVWWIGLIGALLATVALLKAVTLVLRALKDIHQLAGLTHEAAQGVAANVAAVSKLPALEEPARELRESSSALASAAVSVEQKLDGLGSGRAADGG